MLLARYDGNTRHHTSVSCPIFIRAFLVEDARGTRAGLVALDLCGIDAETVAIAERAAREAGVPPERLTLNSSHNHSAPNFDITLSLYFEHTSREEVSLTAYTAFVRGEIRTVLQRGGSRGQAT